MKISGSLEDVGIAEVMQVIHFGARTGRLTVASLDRRAEISFIKGAVVQAWAQGAERLGDLLLRDGAILLRELDEALEAQREVLPARALGRVLLDRGTVTAGVLNQALGRQILGAVREVARWRQGSFSFEVAGSVSGDVLSRPVQDVVPGLRFEVPALLAQLAPRASEHDDTKPMARPAAQSVAAAGNVRVGPWSREALVQEFSPAPEIAASADAGLTMIEVGGRLLVPAVPPVPQEEPAPWPEVRVLSGDRGLFSALAAALDEEPVTVRWGARGQDEGETPALVVLDARGQAPEDLLSIVQRSRPAPVVAVVAGSEDTVRAYEAGAVAVVPPELEAMVACVRRFARTPKPRPEPAGGSGERVVVERLRRFLDEVRSGLYSATVSLSLMNMVAESAERGILFLAREEELAVLGAFGAQWPAGSPLSSLLRDFHLSAADAADLRRQTVDGARRVTVDVLPEALLRKIGPPRSGEAALVPVTGQESLVALVYADNGTLDVRLRDLDLIEVATAQIGLAFENELLRRRLRDRER